MKIINTESTHTVRIYEEIIDEKGNLYFDFEVKNDIPYAEIKKDVEKYNAAQEELGTGFTMRVRMVETTKETTWTEF